MPGDLSHSGQPPPPSTLWGKERQRASPTGPQTAVRHIRAARRGPETKRPRNRQKCGPGDKEETETRRQTTTGEEAEVTELRGGDTDWETDWDDSDRQTGG